jgi:hypothetical protein
MMRSDQRADPTCIFPAWQKPEDTTCVNLTQAQNGQKARKNRAFSSSLELIQLVGQARIFRQKFLHKPRKTSCTTKHYLYDD